MIVTKCFCVLLCLLAAARCGLFQEIGREKRALSTVCVEVKPSENDKSQHSYFMCKGKSQSRSSDNEDFGQPERHSLSLEHEPVMPFGYFSDDHMNFAERRMDRHEPYYFSEHPFEKRIGEIPQERRFHERPVDFHNQRSKLPFDRHYLDKEDEVKSSMKLIFESGPKDNPNVLFMTSGKNQPTPVILPQQPPSYNHPPQASTPHHQPAKQNCCFGPFPPCKQHLYPPQLPFLGAPQHSDVFGAQKSNSYHNPELQQSTLQGPQHNPSRPIFDPRLMPQQQHPHPFFPPQDNQHQETSNQQFLQPRAFIEPQPQSFLSHPNHFKPEERHFSVPQPHEAVNQQFFPPSIPTGFLGPHQIPSSHHNPHPMPQNNPQLASIEKQSPTTFIEPHPTFHHNPDPQLGNPPEEAPSKFQIPYKALANEDFSSVEKPMGRTFNVTQNPAADSNTEKPMTVAVPSPTVAIPRKAVASPSPPVANPSPKLAPRPTAARPTAARPTAARPTAARPSPTTARPSPTTTRPRSTTASSREDSDEVRVQDFQKPKAKLISVVSKMQSLSDHIKNGTELNHHYDLTVEASGEEADD